MKETGNGKPGGESVLVRILVGGVLLLAASFKAYQLATEPTPETGLMTSRWFLTAVVEFELLLGLCLIFGVFARAVWTAAIACFTLFTCVTLYKALSGEASCGCFGAVQINPWFTLALDVGIVVALLRYAPACVGKKSTADARPTAHYVAMFAVWFVVAISAGWGMTRFTATTVDDDGVLRGDGEIVVLEPETWAGKRFPLLPHIDLGDRLAKGGWVVLLYHHDCPQCREVLPQYESLASIVGDESTPNVALVEVPPFGPRENLPLSRAHRARLRDTKDWFVQTPTEIRLNDGTVIAVRGAKELESDDDGLGRKDAVVKAGIPPSAEVVAHHVQYKPGAKP